MSTAAFPRLGNSALARLTPLGLALSVAHTCPVVPPSRDRCGRARHRCSQASRCSLWLQSLPWWVARGMNRVSLSSPTRGCCVLPPPCLAVSRRPSWWGRRSSGGSSSSLTGLGPRPPSVFLPPPHVSSPGPAVFRGSASPARTRSGLRRRGAPKFHRRSVRPRPCAQAACSASTLWNRRHSGSDPVWGVLFLISMGQLPSLPASCGASVRRG